MDVFWQERRSGLPDMQQLAHAIIRLLAAALLGAITGFEHGKFGKAAAGLRLHILLALGTCVFIVACSGFGMSADALSRVSQGIVTGIGFLGPGSILELNQGIFKD